MSNRVFISGVDTSKLPKLKAEELADLLKKVKAGDEFSREEFIVANLRLVLSVLQKYSSRSVKADDMFQVGCVGLLKAIDNFDETLNVKFSTYAVPMIMGEIKRYLRDNNSVRVPRSMRDVAFKALRAREILSTESEEASLESVAKFLEIPLTEITFALDAISDTLSLSEPIYSDGDEEVSLENQISDNKNCEENLFDDIVIADAIKKLDPREREIILLRYYIGKTQVEVSEEVGISQAQVSRLEKNALKTMKGLISDQ